MKKTSRNRPPRRSVFSSDSGYGYTCQNPLNHSVADILRRIFFTF